MTEKERHAAVVILGSVEDGIVKFKERLKDLAGFYTRQNAESFNKFFTHDLNSIYYRVEFETLRGEPTLRFKKGTSTYDLTRGSWANNYKELFSRCCKTRFKNPEVATTRLPGSNWSSGRSYLCNGDPGDREQPTDNQLWGHTVAKEQHARNQGEHRKQ